MMFDLCLNDGSNITLGATFERDFTLGALHGILAFEKGGITVLSAQNTRALIPLFWRIVLWFFLHM